MDRKPGGQIRRHGRKFAFTLRRGGVERVWVVPSFPLAVEARRRAKLEGWEE